MTRYAIVVLLGLLMTAGARGVATPPNTGQLSEETLDNVLKSIGLEPTKTEKRYDFAFKTSIQGEEWKFSMSAVLSRNEESVWVMAWLDQIPRTSSNVPRTALLRMLAANDRLGNGKFFAYIPTNRRFVLQGVVPNEKMTSRKLRAVLRDLAMSVADEYPIWTTANWNSKKQPSQRVADKSSSGRSVRRNSANPKRSNRVRASESASKYQDRKIN